MIRKFIASPIDRILNKKSRNAIENGAVAEAIERIESDIERLEGLKASLENRGLVQLSSATNVTDSTGLALPVTEKNASIDGSLASDIQKIENLLLNCLRERGTVKNFNTTFQNGIYVFGGGSGVQGAPNNNDFGMLVCFVCDSYAFQMFFGLASKWIYFRGTTRKGNSESWSEWEHMFTSVIST